MTDKLTQAVTEQPYMDRSTSWGMPMREFESKAKKAGIREAWNKVCSAIKQRDGCSWNEARVRGADEFKEALEKWESDGCFDHLSEDDAAFVAKCKEGLALPLPLRVGIEKELDWVGANLWRALPDVQRAPSLTALNMLIDARTDQGARRTFWSTCLSKRLSPGDSKTKSKGTIKEDVEDVDADNHEDELRRRLFGGEQAGG